jgi:hypothetical protein
VCILIDRLTNCYIHEIDCGVHNPASLTNTYIYRSSHSSLGVLYISPLINPIRVVVFVQIGMQMDVKIAIDPIAQTYTTSHNNTACLLQPFQHLRQKFLRQFLKLIIIIIVALLLLVLAAILLLWCSRVSSLLLTTILLLLLIMIVMWLLLMLTSMVSSLLVRVPRVRWGHNCRTTLEIDVHSTCVLFCRVLKA